MKKQLNRLTVVLLIVQFTGCSLLMNSGLAPDSVFRFANDRNASDGKHSATSDGKIANPPARTLRFDGHEVVLGESEAQSMDVARLVAVLEPLVLQQRLQSAASIVMRHREVAERMLYERWATSADDPVIQLTAETLSRRSGHADANWKSLLSYARANKLAATQYLGLRNAFAEELKSTEPSGQAAEKLLQASVKVAHPLVRIDALRLLGLRELVADRHAWAESQFRQAIELAGSSGNDLAAADLWIAVAETARRSNQPAIASSAWINAVGIHLASVKSDKAADVSFWLLAEKTKPDSSNWPTEIAQVLGPQVQRIGCSQDIGSEAILWSAVAQTQFERGDMQMALVNFKRAEALVHGNNMQWLKIGQAKCLAAMNQAPAASAILSGPATSADSAVSAAATAAMGSIKLQAGAYQQGAQLLHKALSQGSAQWPGRGQAIADLAIAQLILSDTESGLSALHDAQKQLEQTGERTLLVQSLDNELRLLEHENRTQLISAVKARILQLERL